MNSELLFSLSDTDQQARSLLAPLKNTEDKTDWPAYLVLADYLEEKNLQELSHVFRWMGTRHIRPKYRDFYYSRSVRPGQLIPFRRVPTKVSWAWFRKGVHSRILVKEKLLEHHLLPDDVFSLFGPIYYRLYPTFEEAVTSLSGVLERLRSNYEVNP